MNLSSYEKPQKILLQKGDDGIGIALIFDRILGWMIEKINGRFHYLEF